MEQHTEKIQKKLLLELDTQPSLRKSLLNALDKLVKDHPNLYIRAHYTESYPGKPSEPAITVKADYSTVEAHQELKDSVQQIVREAEEKDVLIYTYVERRSSNGRPFDTQS